MIETPEVFLLLNSNYFTGFSLLSTAKCFGLKNIKQI